MPTRLEAKVEIAFPTPPRSTSPIWVDVTDSVLLIPSAKRGRQHELNEFQAGSGSIVLDNSDRRFDPTYTSSPYYPNVRPMRRCRISGIGPMPATLTVSGNEVTDATRAAAAALATSSSGQMCDGLTNDSSFGIHRAATNLFRRGQCDAITDWNTLAPTGVVTRTIDATTPAPFSPQSEKYVCDGAGANQGCAAATNTGQAAATGVVATGGIWFKGDVGVSYWFRPRWVNTDATVTDHAQVAFVATGNWQLLVNPTSNVTVAAGKTGDKIEFHVRTLNATATTFWVAHAMLEKGQAVVAPYVATSGGSTATHSAGRVQAPASLLDETQGWIAMRVRMGIASANVVNNRFFWWGVNDSRISVQATSTTLQAINDSGPNDTANTNLTWAAGDIITVICRWTATQISLSGNGGAFGTPATRTAVPSIAASTFGIGLQEDGGITGQIDGDVLWFACGTGVLTDGSSNSRNDVATLNALGNTDPDFSVMHQAAQITATMPFSTTSYSALTTVPKFTGYVMEWPPDWSGLDYSELTVQLVDGIGPLSMSPLVGAFSQQLTGARISAVLDAVGWPAGERLISTGLSTCVAVTFVPTDKQMAWQHILDVANTENGLAFIDAQGRFVFRDRAATLTAPYTTSQFTFDDTNAALLFDDLTPTEEDDLLWNSVTVTDSSGVASTAIDSTSEDEYWPRSLQISTLLPAGSSEALDHAAFELAQFKDPAVRFKSLDYMPMLNDTLATQTLTREIGDRLTIKKTPPGPPPQVSADAVIQSIEDQWVPGGGDAPPTWTTIYELSGAISGTYATFDGTAIFDDPGAKFPY